MKMSYQKDMAKFRAEKRKEEELTEKLGRIPCVLCGSKRIPQVAHHPELGMMCVNQDIHEEERKALIKNEIAKAGGQQVPYAVLKKAASLATKDEKQNDIVCFVETCQKAGTEDSYKAALTVVSFPYQYGGFEEHIQEIEQNPNGKFFPIGFAFGWK